MRPFSWCLLALCMFTAVPASAASVPDLSARVPGAAPALPDSGPRIRLSARMEIPAGSERAAVFSSNPTSHKAQIIGPFLFATEDTITMRNAEMNGALVAVPTLHITKLEISDGKSSNGGTGALVGFAVGALLSLVAISSGESTDMDSPAMFGLAALGGGALGAVVGAGIGDASSSERWREVSLAELRSPVRP